MKIQRAVQKEKVQVVRRICVVEHAWSTLKKESRGGEINKAIADFQKEGAPEQEGWQNLTDMDGGGRTLRS